MARVLVVRERGAAEETARELTALGHDPVLLPLEEVVHLEIPAEEDDFDGFVVTSAQAVPVLADLYRGDERPCLAVGEASASALRASGFANVHAGQGRAETLPRLASRIFEGSAARPRLLYAAGRNRSGSLEAAFSEEDADILVREAYDVVRKSPDEGVTRRLVDGPPIDAVLLLSRAQASAFLKLLLPRLRMGGHAPRLLCLSERIAGIFGDEAQKGVEISPEPTLRLLFERL
ncbi:uroporphyrinogen-III synthase [Fulvimarina endophytica]|nr:uroporphyrinogen-III synthase [Fulvimarina endophytica]